MKGYDTAEYAKSRLLETLVRLGDKPVVVRNCIQGEGTTIIVQYTEIGGEKETKMAPLTEFNLDPVPLGYVNFGKEALYVSRMPMRKDWRQGLRGINMVSTNGSTLFHLPFRVVVNTIVGSFPSFQSTLEALNKNLKQPVISQAFCRDFSINRGGDLKYKDVFTVGTVNMNNGDINIGANYNWVRESLEESLVA